jgi:transposase InsO family protein
MSISPIFTFAPVPLTNETSPLAHAAAIVRRRLADNPVVAVPRHRIRPPVEKKLAEVAAA